MPDANGRQPGFGCRVLDLLARVRCRPAGPVPVAPSDGSHAASSQAILQEARLGSGQPSFRRSYPENAHRREESLAVLHGFQGPFKSV
jgi:hypothetical protein